MADNAPSIESLGAPLAFRAGAHGRAPEAQSLRGESGCLVLARSLAGMQKEALVCSASGALWRLTCDEGPYLNGADVAPFPLAFVTAGLTISIASALRRLARADGAELSGLTLTLDNYYTMEGSAIRGTMTGGALRPEVSASATDMAPEVLDALLARAIRASEAAAFFRDSLANEFSMHLNGDLAPLRDVRSTTSEILPPPGGIFDDLEIAAESEDAPEILSKLQAAEQLFGIDGGAGSSLQPEQKRTLHVRGILSLSPAGLFEVKIQLFKPIGSVFHFVGDDASGDNARAPGGVDYLSAGVAFCFMTQLGRYAQIVKQKLTSYEIVQETRFWPAADGGAARALPIVTHVYLESEEDLERNQQLVKMGEQTCFAHAAMSSVVEPALAAR